MPPWFIRSEHDPKGRAVDSAQRVLEGLRDGDWEPSDEVRGPGERDWTPIEDHPAFAEAVAGDGAAPPNEHKDENPSRHESADRRVARAFDLLHPHD